MASDKRGQPPKLDKRFIVKLSIEEFELLKVWTPPRVLVETCKAEGCTESPWPSFDGLCFNHGMFPETPGT